MSVLQTWILSPLGCFLWMIYDFCLRRTHRGIWTAGPATSRCPAAGVAFRTSVSVVTEDTWAPLLSWAVLHLLGEIYGEKEGTWFLRLSHHHGDSKPRQVLLLTHLLGKVTGIPWRAAVGHVRATHSLKKDKQRDRIRGPFKPRFPKCPLLTSGYGQQLYPLVPRQQVSLFGHWCPSGHLTQATTPSRIAPATRHRVNFDICKGNTSTRGKSANLRLGLSEGLFTGGKSAFPSG